MLQIQVISHDPSMITLAYKPYVMCFFIYLSSCAWSWCHIMCRWRSWHGQSLGNVFIFIKCISPFGFQRVDFINIPTQIYVVLLNGIIGTHELEVSWLPLYLVRIFYSRYGFSYIMEGYSKRAKKGGNFDECD